ncbi:nitrate- and nitrite sensing domain-containing protein [Micromonospora sp. WMMD729]|uniref:nitrate- and nitrite sensing domain-containing protein n=1 Tax=Micromonospora sp. WMMD729 TaxID=3404127 RepID=UPI003BF54259
MTRAGRPGVRLLAAAAVLLTLWSYAAYLTCQDAVDLLRVRALADTLGQPIDRLVLSLQTERRATVETLAGAAPARATLAEARAATDRAAAQVRAFGNGHDLRLLSAGTVRDRADTLIRRLNGLGAIRSRLDDGQLDQAGAVDGYDTLVDAAFDVYGPEWGAYESRLAGDTRAVIALARARELLAREDTLVTAAVVSGRLGSEERRRLSELVAVQRYARAEATAGLPDGGQGEHQRLVAGPEFAGLLAVENTLLRPDRADALRGVSTQDWRAAADPALNALHESVTSTARASVERATPGAAVVVGRTGLVVGLGLIAVLAVLFGWAGAVRREPDDQAAPGTEPPAAPVDPVPPDAVSDGGGDGPDRRTAELFLRIIRRNQVLLRDQLDLLDAMQRRERDATEADELFQLDHLTTRIRRNVEKVITLAGATPARRWRRPVPLLDVTRGAVAEVPEYHRVLVAPHWPWSLAGPAVTDVVHLLAELIENALTVSATDTTVRVTGEHRPHGCAIAVVDDGPGLDAAALDALNHLLASPPSEAPTDAGGLYAVARLAARCGAQVTLRPSRRGGTAAIVYLPAELVTVTGGGPGPVAAGAAHRPTSGAPPRPAAADAGRTGSADGLPMRVRQSGPTVPGPGNAGPETVELPITRTTRRHR